MPRNLLTDGDTRYTQSNGNTVRPVLSDLLWRHQKNPPSAGTLTHLEGHPHPSFDDFMGETPSAPWHGDGTGSELRDAPVSESPCQLKLTLREGSLGYHVRITLTPLWFSSILGALGGMCGKPHVPNSSRHVPFPKPSEWPYGERS